jgi:DNA-binding transcriptional regulator GbsR (MarR family)
MNKQTKGRLTIIPPVGPEPTSKDPLDYWVRWVGIAYRQSVESIVETGVRIAKTYIEFEEEGQKAISEQLGMSQSTVSKLMSIGQCAVLIKYSSKQQLPAAYTVLYELSQFDPKLLAEKLGTGEINPGTQLKDVLRMKANGKSGSTSSLSEEAERDEPKSRRAPLNEWDKLSELIEGFLSAVDQLAKEVLKKARASGEVEKELVKADIIDLFKEQVEKGFDARLDKLRLDLRGPPVTTAVHVGPRGKRRTK